MEVMTLQLEIKVDSTGRLIVPPGSVVTGVLNLANRQDVKSLPAGLSASCLDLSGSAVESLPGGMTVTGWLDIQNTAIRIDDLPFDLKVGTFLYCTINGKPACVTPKREARV